MEKEHIGAAGHILRAYLMTFKKLLQVQKIFFRSNNESQHPIKCSNDLKG